MSGSLLELRGVVKEYTVPGGLWRKAHLRAVDGVDLSVGAGEIVGLIGESGSGKTTLGRCALGLTDLTDGSASYDGIEIGTGDGATRRRLHREMQVVFQHPLAALNPRMTVEATIAEPLTTHGLARGAELRHRVEELLESVGLAGSLCDRRPHELSGGQAQRVVIARALATRPRLLILDEPTASLDVIVQAQILNLLAELQREHGIAYLVISHDLSVVRHLADTVFVMYLGRVVESGPAGRVLARPRHPYTRALVASMRGGGRETLDRPALPGETPPAWEIPAGCRFHPRCAVYAERGNPSVCTTVDPGLDTVDDRHIVACHFAPPPAGAETGRSGAHPTTLRMAVEGSR